MANEIDTLMDLDPLELTSTNIDQIIAYHRKNRAMIASGAKPKRESGPKVDISAALQGLLAQEPKPVVSGIRRR